MRLMNGLSGLRGVILSEAAGKQLVLKIDVLEAGKMVSCKNLSNFTVGSAWVRACFNTAGLVACSGYAVVITYRKCYKERHPVNL